MKPLNVQFASLPSMNVGHSRYPDLSRSGEKRELVWRQIEGEKWNCPESERQREQTETEGERKIESEREQKRESKQDSERDRDWGRSDR